ncbi:MAG: hypothetical protein AAGF23_08625, partial [Acidobacteriota bacterium]
MSSEPSWNLALSLEERRALVERLDLLDGNGPPDDPEAARQRIERWRRETGLANDRLFERRLGQDGLTRADFARLLTEPPPEIAEPPDWLLEFLDAWDTRTSKPMPTAAADRRPEAGLLELVRPLLDDAYGRLRTRLAAPGSDDLEKAGLGSPVGRRRGHGLRGAGVP